MASVVRSIAGFDSNPGPIKTVFSPGTKTVLKRLLNDAISLIDSDELCDSAGIGVLAGHLEELGNHVDPSDNQFSLGFSGDLKDPELSDKLHRAYDETWQGILESRQSLWSDGWFPADADEIGDDEETGDDDIEIAEAGDDRSSDISSRLNHRPAIAGNADSQTCRLRIFVNDDLRLSTSELNPGVTKLLISHIESILTEAPIGFGTPEELGVMASGLLDIAYGDSEGSEADAIHEQFLFGLRNGGASNTTIQPDPIGRCYSDAAKAGLVSILRAGIKGIQSGYIGAAGDFGLLAMRIAGACEHFDRLPEPGDGKARIIDGMVNEWENEQLEAFLDSELNTTEN